MNNLPIVIQALPKWDADYSSTALNISRQLSKTRKVFYVEHPYTWSDRLKPRLSSKIQRRKKITEKPYPELPDFTVIYPPLVPSVNALPQSDVYAFIQKSIALAVRKRIESVLESEHIEEVIYVNSFDPTYWETRPAQTKGTVYHSVDWIGGEPYIARHGMSAERIAASQADAVITTSPALRDNLQKYNSNTFCVENAVDYTLFSTPQNRPELYTKLSGPIVVYGGNIGIRMDQDLIRKVVSAHPSWNFVFVGPIDRQYVQPEDFNNYGNLHFTGPKPQKELVSYLHHADIGWIPFLKNELTRHISPLKLNEYLAAGLPVVTSTFAPFNDPANLLFQFAESDQCSAQINRALQSNSTDGIILKRQKEALRHTWEQKTEEWITILTKHFKSEKVEL